jgi:hypothetical protein
VPFAQGNDMVCPDRSDQLFGEAVLPRRAWDNGLVADAHDSYCLTAGTFLRNHLPRIA